MDYQLDKDLTEFRATVIESKALIRVLTKAIKQSDNKKEEK